MQYRFKIKATQHKNSKVLFTSGWFQCYSVLDAILVKDEFIESRPEYNECYSVVDSRVEKTKQ